MPCPEIAFRVRREAHSTVGLPSHQLEDAARREGPHPEISRQDAEAGLEVITIFAAVEQSRFEVEYGARCTLIEPFGGHLRGHVQGELEPDRPHPAAAKLLREQWEKA